MKDIPNTPRLSLLSYISIALLIAICFLGITALIHRSSSQRTSKTEPVKELLIADEFIIINKKLQSVTLTDFHGIVIWYTSPQLMRGQSKIGTIIYNFQQTINTEPVELHGNSRTLEVPKEGHALFLKSTKNTDYIKDYKYYPQIEVE